MQQLSRLSYGLLPQDPGVYLFLDAKGRVIYVGKAKNLRARVSSYFLKGANLGEKTKLLINTIEKIQYILVNSEIESLLLEANLIKKYNPTFNVRFTDGKAYPLIRVCVEDSYPQVLIVRRITNKKSLYFGPYPNASALRMVLRIIRRIFPFVSVRNHPKKFCLYYHLGLCPCPQIKNLPESKTNYRKNIYYVTMFLKGHSKKIIKDLEKERNQYSKNEEFEKAKLIQTKISAIRLITTAVVKPNEYEVNPNLYSDLRKKEIEQLLICLKRNNVNVGKLERIECFDISNISGKHATGSMVVFTNAEKDSSSYRRFRIKLDSSTPNDLAMMKEVLLRRLKHYEWPFPDLIVVDGGRGQIAYVLQALKAFGLNIPVIGLAKKQELIITSDFKTIQLPRDDPALQLLIRIRDEAHRFAISYHRKLRSLAISW